MNDPFERMRTGQRKGTRARCAKSGRKRSKTSVRSVSASASNLTVTVMSNPVLPPELLDHIVDLLHDDVDTLRNCCLVSKPWIPGTRKHLFATVQFPSSKTLQAWKDVFLNASTSPARYTKSFVMTYPSDVGEGEWIPTFSRIKCLKVVIKDFEISVAPFQRFLPTLNACLRSTLTCFQPHLLVPFSRGPFRGIMLWD